MRGIYQDKRTPLLSDETAKNVLRVQWEEQVKGRKNCA